VVDSARLGRAERRDALLDAAARMVARGDIDGVSMESVAAATRVSRALVYKHFANRRELLGALYEREASRLHAELTAAVEAADSLDGQVRALVHGALDAQASRGATFAALGQAGARTPAQRELQRRRDRRTLEFFTRSARAELGVDEDDASVVLGVALGAIASVLSRWRQDPTDEHAGRLEEAFVAMTVGGLERLTRGGVRHPVRRRAPSAPPEPTAGASVLA
jgi:AcrR family transcriptional regulator